MSLFSMGTFSLKYSLKTGMKNHNSWKDGPLLLTPDIKETKKPNLVTFLAWPSSCSAGDRDSDHKKETNSNNLGLGCTNFPEAICSHFKLPSNTNIDSKPKSGLCFTGCWFQISDLQITDLQVFRSVYSSESRERKILMHLWENWVWSQSKPLSFAEQMLLHKVWGGFITQHNN